MSFDAVTPLPAVALPDDAARAGHTALQGSWPHAVVVPLSTSNKYNACPFGPTRMLPYFALCATLTVAPLVLLEPDAGAAAVLLVALPEVCGAAVVVDELLLLDDP